MKNRNASTIIKKELKKIADDGIWTKTNRRVLEPKINKSSAEKECARHGQNQENENKKSDYRFENFPLRRFLGKNEVFKSQIDWRNQTCNKNDTWVQLSIRIISTGTFDKFAEASFWGKEKEKLFFIQIFLWLYDNFFGHLS